MQYRRARSTRDLALAITALVVAACGAGGGATSGQAPAATGAGSVAVTSTSGPSAEAEPLPEDIPVPSIDAAAGGPAGSGLVTITDGGMVTATADDGTEYVLVIPPGALGEDVTVTLQPLAGSTALGPIVAGADFAPSGLELGVAGTLTVSLADARPAGLVGLSFTGDPAATSGRLLAGTGEDATGSVLVFSVPHFSGSVSVSTGANADSLYTTWSSTKDGTTPADRQAVAETRHAAATLAERAGRISSDTADDIRTRATEEWLDAESDRLVDDPTMERIAATGDPADLDALGEAVARVYQHEHDRQISGYGNDEKSQAAMSAVTSAYASRLAKITERLASEEVARAANSGRVSDLEDIHRLIVAATVVEHQLQLLGKEGDETMTLILGLNHTIATSLEKSCSDAPVPVSMILGFKRVAALFGDDETADVDWATLERCNGGTPAPPLDFGPFGADGRVTYNTTIEDNFATTSYTVELDLKVREGEEALIFAKGSTFKGTYTIDPKPVYGEGGELVPYTCPTSYSWEGTMGTMGNSDGWDPGSTPSEEGNGFAIGGGDGDDLVFMAGVSVNSDDWPDGCTAPSVAFGCPDEYGITGKLVGSLPMEWSYACSSVKGVNPFVSVGGRMIQVEVRE